MVLLRNIKNLALARKNCISREVRLSGEIRIGASVLRGLRLLAVPPAFVQLAHRGQAALHATKAGRSRLEPPDARDTRRESRTPRRGRKAILRRTRCPFAPRRAHSLLQHCLWRANSSCEEPPGRWPRLGCQTPGLSWVPRYSRLWQSLTAPEKIGLS